VPRDRWLTPVEVAALLDALPAHRQRWVLLAVYTGARKSEVEGIRWGEHVNLKARRILLPGTKTVRARRVVPVADPLAAELDRESSREGPVVEPWPNVRRDLVAACRRLRMSPATPNDLRRTFASWLKQRGVDSMAVARLLGHTSSRMVETVYGHLSDTVLAGAVALLPALPSAAEVRSTCVANSGEPTADRRSDEVTQPRDTSGNLGAAGEIRTRDLRIRSPVLYPAELRPQAMMSMTYELPSLASSSSVTLA